MPVTAVETAPSPACVLLAEDDFELRRLLIRGLRKDGYDIVEVASGAELVHRLGLNLQEPERVEAVDLIIMDIRMPGWSGLEVLEALRSIGCQIPVIVMTAFGDDETHRTALRLGAASVLDKPLDPDHLRRVVINTLGRGDS